MSVTLRKETACRGSMDGHEPVSLSGMVGTAGVSSQRDNEPKPEKGMREKISEKRYNFNVYSSQYEANFFGLVCGEKLRGHHNVKNFLCAVWSSK